MTRKKLTRLTAVIIAAISFFIFFFNSGVAVHAATSTSTDVLSDLMKDENFNTADYPSKANDYGLYVMQLAESTDGGLLLYVYQPSGTAYKLRAVEVRLSREAVYKTWADYKLTLLNYSGVFYKYQVEGLKVNNDAIRYYDITAIFRQWYKAIDKDPPTGQTVNKVSYEVGQLWGARNVNGETVYKMRTTETLKITDKHVGFVRYPEGFSWLEYGACDRHFVAFSTDRKIDSLIEADVTYLMRNYHYTPLAGKSFGEYIEPDPAKLKYSDIASTSPDLFAHTYTWERIESTDAFLKEVELSDEDTKKVKDKQWVLSFTETPYTVDGATVALGGLIGGLISPGLGVALGGALAAITYDAVEVSEVSVLRLKFETDGRVYNLGVVDNKQTGSLKPSNGANPWAWWQWALLIIGIIIIVAVVLTVLSVIFPPFGRVLKIILSAIWKVICAPFKLIAVLIDKGNERWERGRAERERRRAERERKREERAAAKRKKQRQKAKAKPKARGKK